MLSIVVERGLRQWDGKPFPLPRRVLAGGEQAPLRG